MRMETNVGLGIKTLDEISEENVTYVDTISIDRNEMSERSIV
jgi:hypothetical protein